MVVNAFNQTAVFVLLCCFYCGCTICSMVYFFFEPNPIVIKNEDMQNKIYPPMKTSLSNTNNTNNTSNTSNTNNTKEELTLVYPIQ